VKTKFMKSWYITVGGLTGVAIIYFIVRFIAYSIDPDNITATYQTMDVIGFIFLGIALLMLIALIPMAKINEAKEMKLQQQKALEQEKLAKYKKKK